MRTNFNELKKGLELRARKPVTVYLEGSVPSSDLETYQEPTVAGEVLPEGSVLTVHEKFNKKLVAGGMEYSLKLIRAIDASGRAVIARWEHASGCLELAHASEASGLSFSLSPGEEFVILDDRNPGFVYTPKSMHYFDAAKHSTLGDSVWSTKLSERKGFDEKTLFFFLDLASDRINTNHLWTPAPLGPAAFSYLHLGSCNTSNNWTATDWDHLRLAKYSKSTRSLMPGHVDFPFAELHARAQALRSAYKALGPAVSEAMDEFSRRSDSLKGYCVLRTSAKLAGLKMPGEIQEGKDAAIKGALASAGIKPADCIIKNLACADAAVLLPKALGEKLVDSYAKKPEAGREWKLHDESELTAVVKLSDLRGYHESIAAVKENSTAGLVKKSFKP